MSVGCSVALHCLDFPSTSFKPFIASCCPALSTGPVLAAAAAVTARPPVPGATPRATELTWLTTCPVIFDSEGATVGGEIHGSPRRALASCGAGPTRPTAANVDSPTPFTNCVSWLLHGNWGHYRAGLCLVVPTALLAFVIYLASHLSPRRGTASFTWAGAPNFNSPLSAVDLSRVGVDIRTDPFPWPGVVAVAETYAAAARDLYVPENISLRLDAPGLRHVNLKSWLSTIHHDPKWVGRENKSEPLLRRLVQDPSVLITRTNITVTAHMLGDLAEPLMVAAQNLLTVGLGSQHPEYAALKTLVRSAGEEASSPLHHAYGLWENLHLAASRWSTTSESWLQRLAWRLRHYGPVAPGMGDTPLQRGSRAPSFQQLVEQERAQERNTGRRPSLPQLLRAGSRLSPNATFLLREMISRLGQEGLGRTWHNGGLCTPLDLLDEVALGRCNANGTFSYRTGSRVVTEKRHPYHDIRLGARGHYVDRTLLGALRDVLCDAEDSLGALGAAAERARDRVADAVEARGGISVFESLAGYFSDGVQKRRAALDRLLEVFHPLYSSLKLQRRILAGVARTMQRACLLQDALRTHAQSLLEDPSKLWSLELYFDNDQDILLTFVTFPTPEDTAMLMEAELARIKGRDELAWDDWYLDPIDSLLERDMLGKSSRWMERVGLDRWLKLLPEE